MYYFCINPRQFFAFVNKDDFLQIAKDILFANKYLTLVKQKPTTKNLVLLLSLIYFLLIAHPLINNPDVSRTKQY